MGRWAAVLVLVALCAAPLAADDSDQAYTIAFRPPVGSTLRYRLTSSGLGDVAILGSNLTVSGVLVFSTKVVKVEDNGDVTVDTTLESGKVQVEQLVLPVETVGETARLRIDSRDNPVEVLQPLESMLPAATIDLGTTLLYLHMGMILPDEPVHVGDIWSATHDTLRYDGAPMSYSGRNELKEVKEVDGRKVAVIFSKLVCPVNVDVTGYKIQGKFYTDMTSEVFMDTGELYHRISETRAVLMAEGQDVYNLEATLHDMKTECSLVKETKVSEASGSSPSPKGNQ